MANEFTVSGTLQLRNGSQTYASQPGSYRSDQSAQGGPTPGTISVSTTGLNLNLGQLTQPGLCRMQNLDPANRVEWGIHDGALFHPVGEMLPGEFVIFRISRNVGEEEDVPGTGTTSVVNSLFLRSAAGTCKVLVEAFES